MAKNFSPQTMAACCEVLSQVFTDSELQNFFTKFGLLNIYRRLPLGVSKLKRIQEVIAYLDRPNRTEDTDEVWDAIIIEAVKQIKGRVGNSSPLLEKIEKCLALDGYQIESDKVLRTLPALPETIAIREKLEQKLLELGWVIPLKHLQHARANYAEGQWEAANASIRSFLQAIFDYIAEAMPDFPKDKLAAGGKRRQFLEMKGFLTKEEGELLRALFKILHTKGAHPGLSNESDCSSRILMSIGIGWRALSRFLEEVR